MPPIYETGHLKNIANFQDLISFCEGYGTAYNPIKESLKIAQLQTLHQDVQDKFNETKTKKVTFDLATNDRQLAFADLKPLATKIINAFSVCGADPLAVADAKTINRKLQGYSKKQQPPTPEEGEGNEGENDSPPSGDGGLASTSQQSYDRLIDHFDNFIQILLQAPAYTPNEEDIKIETLQTKLANLQAVNTALVAAYTPYSNAMITRNDALYNPLTGLVQTAKEVKLYVKSVFGATSTQYKQVSAIEFTKPR
ncbi:MAG: hypothetical protein LBE36_01455 [Flavobacteriaceae bacterium]|nr:hypothetical protein [Flavobacteriaceae bacterium]